MAWLRKTKVPGAAPGGYTWTTLEDVVEVPEELASQLVQIPDAGFLSIPEPVAAPAAASPEQPAAENVASAASAESTGSAAEVGDAAPAVPESVPAEVADGDAPKTAGRRTTKKAAAKPPTE